MKPLILTFVALVLFSTTGTAQDVLVHTGQVNAPSYFIVVISGVLLAFGFQFLLTALSIAVGVTSIDNIKESYVESKYSRGNDDDDDNISMGVKMTTALGVWNLWTVSLSLFGATYLALKLIPVSTDMTLITLALVIWATFFMLMFYLESRLVGTLVGSLINTAVAGLKASSSAVVSAFAPTPKSEIQDIANTTIEKIRQEFSVDFDTDGIMSTLDKYVNKIDNKLPDYSKLKKDLEDIAANSTGKKAGNDTAAKWTAIQTLIQTALLSEPNPNTEKAKRKLGELKGLLVDVKNAYQQGDTTKESMQNALETSPIDEGKVDEYISQIKEKIQNSKPEQLETIQMEIEKIIQNPQASLESLQAKLKEIDRDTIVQLLTNNTSLTKVQINDYAERAQAALKTVSEKLGITNDDPFTLNLLEQFEGKVRNFINDTDVPELNYYTLKNDVKRAINNPKDSLDIVKHRLSTYDRNTLISVLTATPWLDRSDIHKIADTVESAKTEVSDQMLKIETKARSTMANLERRAVIQADHVRKTAVSAAWWLVTVIVISGITAVAGSLINIF